MIELQSLAKNLMDLKRRECKVIELNRFLTEKVLQRFLPPQMVQDIIAGRTQLDEQARTSNITVLFSDLVGFMRASEHIHSGPCIVGTFSNEMRSEYTAIGSSVNTASRIEGVAESNAIYISQTVRDSLDHENWIAAGNFELKGIGLIPLFRLTPEKPKQDAA